MKKLKLKFKFNSVKIKKQVFKFMPSAKVLKFTKKYGGLSDEDVINLFVGLMNLVKIWQVSEQKIFIGQKLTTITKKLA